MIKIRLVKKFSTGISKLNEKNIINNLKELVEPTRAIKEER